MGAAACVGALRVVGPASWRAAAVHLTSASYRRIDISRKGFSLDVVNGALGGMRSSGSDSMRAVDWQTLAVVKRRFGW